MRLLASLRRLSSSASFFELEPPKQPITFARRLGRRFASESDSSLMFPAQGKSHRFTAEIMLNDFLRSGLRLQQRKN